VRGGGREGGGPRGSLLSFEGGISRFLGGGGSDLSMREAGGGLFKGRYDAAEAYVLQGKEVVILHGRKSGNQTVYTNYIEKGMNLSDEVFTAGIVLIQGVVEGGGVFWREFLSWVVLLVLGGIAVEAQE